MDNVNARNMLVDRLRRARDATENVAEVTRDQMGKYGEGILEVVQVMDAFRNAVTNIPSRNNNLSTPPPSAPIGDGSAAARNVSPSEIISIATTPANSPTRQGGPSRS